jgi:hypothetical protein
MRTDNSSVSVRIKVLAVGINMSAFAKKEPMKYVDDDDKLRGF